MSITAIVGGVIRCHNPYRSSRFHPKNHLLARPDLLACAAVLATASSWAQSTWIGGTSADWADTNNWSPNVVPSGADAIVNTSSGNLATVSTDAAEQPNTLKLGDGVAGTMNVQSGSLTVNGETWLGNTSSGTGVFNISGGTYVANNWLAVGRGGGQGTINMTDGTIAKYGNGQLAIGIDGGSVGVLNQSGGAITCDQNLWLGQSVGSSGEYNLSGTGSITVNDWVAIGREGGTGIWNLNGGSAILGMVHICQSVGSIGTFNLNTNGTLTAGEITTGDSGAASTLNFNGGTLVGGGYNANFLHGLTKANVRSGGAIIDDGGFEITIAQALVHSTIGGDNAIDGGLTKNGSGTLALSGANTFTGDTIVNAGSILQLDATGSSPSTFRLADSAWLNLNYSGTHIVPCLYTNGVALPVGTYNASNLPGFILGTGDLRVAGLVFSSQPRNQLVYLNGNYNQSVTLTSAVIGGSATYQWYYNGNPVSGATSSNLTLSNLQITNAGNLYVVATGSSGSVTSSVVALTIYAVNNNVFVYEGFDYPGSTDNSTPINGTQNGGFGWAAEWTGAGGDTASSIVWLDNLTGGANVPTGFDSWSITNSLNDGGGSRVGRFFDTSTSSELSKQGFIDANGNIGANGKTICLSFLQQPSATGTFYELEFKKADLGDGGRIGGIGNDAGGNNVNLRAGGTRDYSLGAGTTDVNFYVVRIDYKAGNDDVFVYRNPTSITEPATPTLTVSNAADMSLNGLSVGAWGVALRIDEIRLGATWNDAIGMAYSNLLPPSKTANGYKIQFACTLGYSYRIQHAPAVTGPWTDLTTVVGSANAFVEFEDTNAPAGHAFYRTVTP